MLLRMSFSGGILIIMIAAVRFLSANRLPKKYFMMLWASGSQFPWRTLWRIR